MHSYDNINSNQYTGLVFLDLTKAFDSVTHDILLLKLEHYGIRGSTNQLIKSFLFRKQFVSIKVAKSKLLQNTMHEFINKIGQLSIYYSK